MNKQQHRRLWRKLIAMLKKEERKSTMELNGMIEVQAGNKPVECGREQQSEANKKLSEILGERDKIESRLFKVNKTKNVVRNVKDAGSGPAQCYSFPCQIASREFIYNLFIKM